MAGIPQAFPETGGSAVASYDSTDLAEGAGRVAYNLAGTQVSGSVLTKFLTRSSLYSSSSEVSGAVSSSGQQSDLDFDITYLLPQNLSGTCYVNIPHFCAAGGIAGTDTGYLIVRLRHYDGTTETTLASNISPTISSTAGVSASSQIVCVPLIGTQHFKVGDSLRLTVEAWQDHGSGAAGIFAYGIDPANRSTAYLNSIANNPGSSKSTVYVPFRLDP